ncbi:GIY-YIG nuclease family protein [Falsiroseomonas sp.]|uniref:GIY-YIG nuclease family protein n=1 Tax=Falsiroseomonas sp. TaxID=2870721 RepID=UPI00273231E4|nr:GIY-YIG nuclease family protein [Falsiroseomonas sp.]MDP3417351.1 GIY-YIG nuclease family protein [Falsiroseomonas sp.]
MASLIRLTLLANDPDGIRSAFIAGRTTVLMACPWANLPALMSTLEANRPAVYAFVGEPTEGDMLASDEVAYIGECNSFVVRMKTHDKRDSADWSQVLLATSTDGMFNKAHALRAEHLLTERAKKAKKTRLLNGGTSPGTLDEGDKSFVDEFVDNVCVLAQVLGVSFFREFTRRGSQDSRSLMPMSRPFVGPTQSEKVADDISAETFSYSVNGANASMRIDGSQFVVLAQSTLNAAQTDSMGGVAKALRARGIESGAIIPALDGRFLELKEDIAAKSISAAAQLVSGNSVNGKDMWKLKSTGQTYNEWWGQRMRAEQPPITLEQLGLAPQ